LLGHQARQSDQVVGGAAIVPKSREKKAISTGS
jgi:hypothetical protein